MIAIAAHWRWIAVLAIFMLAVGAAGLVAAGTMTVVALVSFGVLALICGVTQMVDAFRYPGWRAMVPHVVIGGCYLFVGIVMIALPVTAALWLTALLAGALIVTGLLRVFVAFQANAGPASLGVGLAGVLSMVLGAAIAIAVEVPGAAALAPPEGAAAWMADWGWIVGGLIALEFIVHGIALMLIAIAARRFHREELALRPSQATGTL